MSKYKQNFTMISDLNDLEEIDDMQMPSSKYGKSVSFDRPSYNPEYDRPDVPNLDKFIKPNNNNKYPPQSGMQTSKNILTPDDTVTYEIPSENLPLVPTGMDAPFYDSYNGPYWNKSYPPFNHADEYNEYNKRSNNYSNLNRYYENFEQTKQPNCVDLAEHAANCKVCAKLYHNDKTIYIIAIIVLVIICILLLKRILDTQ